MMRLVKNLTWIQLALIGAFIIGAYLRLVNFTSTMQFLGDQGRDAIIAKQILKDHDIVLIGPVTSTGNMYLGPLYYYFMVPFLALSYPSPVGPAYAVAVFSIFTLWVLYAVGKEMVGEKEALVATLLMTVSAVAITHSRFSWNPNLAPLVALILLWASFRALTKSSWYIVLMSLCIAVLIQLHYVTLLTIPAAGSIWLIMLYQLFKKKTKDAAAIKTPSFFHEPKVAFFTATLIAIALFIASLTPLIVFDFRHNFINVTALSTFVSQDQDNLTKISSLQKAVKIIKETHGRSMFVLAETYLGKNRSFNTLLVIALLGTVLYVWRKSKGNQKIGYEILLLYLVWGVIGLSFYQSSVFAHYVAYLYPVAYLIYGITIVAWSKHKLGLLLGVALFAGFVGWNLTHLPLKPLSWNVHDVERGAKTILDHVKPGEKYNIVLLTGTGDIEGLNYRYFLDTSDKKPLPKEQWGETETLFIINEDRKLKKVTDSPVYEIVVFPNKNPAEVYTIPDGPEVTVLRK
jgi:4-amino-4-deoxy-L-arabinose transferase-like glycosyltransferase